MGRNLAGALATVAVMKGPAGRTRNPEAVSMAGAPVGAGLVKDRAVVGEAAATGTMGPASPV
jgi:hypothetical protein